MHTASSTARPDGLTDSGPGDVTCGGFYRVREGAGFLRATTSRPAG
jgi:hypothetical protein